MVIDLCSRKVVGWSMRPDMHRSLVIDALEMGLFQRHPQKGQLLFHSDRGSQYASDDFRAVLDQHGVMASMSRKGNCWDNAVTETLFGSLKVERLHGERFETIRQAKDAVLAWLLWYNRQRMHSTLNYLSPVEFECHWENKTFPGRRMRNAATETDGGNAGRWKAWKNDEAVFLPFPPTLEIDQADFHIPTVTTTTTR